MSLLTNKHNISVPMAVWLAADDYDLKPKPFTISATGLLKPIKSIVLGEQIKATNLSASQDIVDLIPSRVGTAIHTAVEVAWEKHYRPALARMGIPESAIDMIDINPEVEDPNRITVRIEERHSKKVGKWTVSGKYDFVYQGKVLDIKTTKVWNWIYGGNDEKYAMQGSIYRWLVPNLIREDEIGIEFLFKDWSPIEVLKDKKYPQLALMTRNIPLKPVAEVQHFIENKLAEIEKYLDADEDEIPDCTKEDLWQKDTTWAWYSKPTNKNASKVFHSLAEAQLHMTQKKGVGVIVERPGVVKFCTYCPAQPICQQASNLIEQGLLTL